MGRITFGKLVIIKKDGSHGPEFPLKQRIYAIGSKEDCDICIKKEDVKDRHAEIEVKMEEDANHVYITNLANDGGVLINDVSMHGGQTQQMVDKDVITISERKIVVEIPGMNFPSLHSSQSPSLSHYLCKNSLK